MRAQGKEIGNTRCNSSAGNTGVNMVTIGLMEEKCVRREKKLVTPHNMIIHSWLAAWNLIYRRYNFVEFIFHFALQFVENKILLFCGAQFYLTALDSGWWAGCSVATNKVRARARGCRRKDENAARNSKNIAK